jgi:hypothetical protein
MSSWVTHNVAQHRKWNEKKWKHMFFVSKSRPTFYETDRISVTGRLINTLRDIFAYQGSLLPSHLVGQILRVMGSEIGILKKSCLLNARSLVTAHEGEIKKPWFLQDGRFPDFHFRFAQLVSLFTTVYRCPVGPYSPQSVSFILFMGLPDSYTVFPYVCEYGEIECICCCCQMSYRDTYTRTRL